MKPIILFILSLLFATTIVSAQDTDRAQPSDANQTPLAVEPRYVFTGARTNTAIATTVHCSNLGDSAVMVQVQLNNFNNQYTITSTQLNLFANRTVTFSFDSANGNTVLYSEDYFGVTTTSIGQGRGIILLDPRDAPVICTAQILDKANAVPTFVVDLPLTEVGSNGLPTAIGQLRSTIAEGKPLWVGQVVAALLLVWLVTRRGVWKQ